MATPVTDRGSWGEGSRVCGGGGDFEAVGTAAVGGSARMRGVRGAGPPLSHGATNVMPSLSGGQLLALTRELPYL